MTSTVARRDAARAGTRLMAGVLAFACGCIAPQRPADVVVVASGADLESANPLVTTHPLSRQVQRHMLLVTLLRYDTALAPQPYLARRLAWSRDHRALTLALASGLRWHDGAPTTARDAAFTLLAARDPATGYARAGELAALDTAIALDDSTLALRFHTPLTAPPGWLAELPLVPQHLLGRWPRAAMRTAPWNDAPVGNGPFRFAGRHRGASWTFVRNDSFPALLGGPPSLHGVAIAVIDEATTKFAGLASGEVDVAGISPAMAALARQDPALRVVTYPVLFGTALVFNTTRPPFDDARVRLAVSRSINREQIVDVALSGFGLASASGVPPDSPLSWRALRERDTLAADALLDAAGWRRGTGGVRARGGRRLEADLLTVGSGDNVAEQLVQADLAARGIVVRLRQTEMGQFIATASARVKTFDMLLAGVPGDLALSQLGAMFATAQRGGTLDYAGYHSAPLDRLLDAAGQAPPGRARRDAWISVQQALDSLSPVTWLFHARGVQGMSRRVRGVRMDLRGELATIHDWTVEPAGPAR